MSDTLFTTGPFDWALLPDGTAEIRRCHGKETILTIPAALEGHPVTRIGAYAFEGCDQLTGITFPESLTSLGDFVFYCCRGLTSVTLPDSLRETGLNPFSFCDRLSELRVSPNHPAFSVENGLLIRREDRQVVCCPRFVPGPVLNVPAGIRSIGGAAFHGCHKLQEIHLPEEVTSIGEHAFTSCVSLREIHLPEGLDSLGGLCFMACRSLRRICLPDSLQRMGDNPFLECNNLREITISQDHPVFVSADGIMLLRREDHRLISSAPGGLPAKAAVPPGTSVIGDGAFLDCSKLEEVCIPDGVTEIGCAAFSECRNLIRLRLPPTLTRLGAQAFASCHSLCELTIPAGVTELGDNLFLDAADELTVTVTAGSPAEAYCRNVPFLLFHAKVAEE